MGALWEFYGSSIAVVAPSLDPSLFSHLVAHLIATTNRKRAMNRATTNGDSETKGFLWVLYGSSIAVVALSLDPSLFGHLVAHLVATTNRKRAMNRATTNGEGVIMGFLSRTLFAHLIAPTELCD